METVQWLPKYNIGIEKIDSQHRMLIELLAKIQHSKETCLGKKETDDIFDTLESFANEHFELEENLMEKINFPYKAGHKRDHLFFKSSLKDWRNDKTIECKSEKISVFLTEWLYEHILHYDLKLKDYM